MGLDKEKLSGELSDRIIQHSVEEKLSELPELIRFSRNKTINYCLSKKVGLKDEPNPRVLVNWVDKNLVEIAPQDKGKIKRFDKFESTWINILVELRGFGLPLDVLQKTRKLLFDYKFDDLSLFKFKFINTILRKPQTLVVFRDGDTRILATETYLEMYKKNGLLPHLSLNLADFIKQEYPNNSLDQNFDISDPIESPEKMKLLYFLRTGDYQFMKVRLSESDVRYIKNIDMLLKSDDVLKAFSEWNFEEITISIDDEADTVITSKK